MGLRIRVKEGKTNPLIKKSSWVEELDILLGAGRFTWSLEVLQEGLKRIP
jgi:hypothetical protein